MRFWSKPPPYTEHYWHDLVWWEKILDCLGWGPTKGRR